LVDTEQKSAGRNDVKDLNRKIDREVKKRLYFASQNKDENKNQKVKAKAYEKRETNKIDRFFI
jgi:hypothetical protein